MDLDEALAGCRFTLGVILLREVLLSRQLSVLVAWLHVGVDIFARPICSHAATADVTRHSWPLGWPVWRLLVLSVGFVVQVHLLKSCRQHGQHSYASASQWERKRGGAESYSSMLR